MRYMYVLIVMTAMTFVAAGSARGQASQNNNKPNPPSKSCPQNYAWDDSKNACEPPSCQKNYGWDDSKNACEPPSCQKNYAWNNSKNACEPNNH